MTRHTPQDDGPRSIEREAAAFAAALRARRRESDHALDCAAARLADLLGPETDDADDAGATRASGSAPAPLRLAGVDEDESSCEPVIVVRDRAARAADRAPA